MTGAAIFEEVLARGGRVVAGGSTPRLLVPEDLRPSVEAHRLSLRAAVQLWALLDTWAGMTEAEWTQEAVDKLHNDIMDIFRDHPAEADGCFRAWRRAHPEAKLS
ncbi:MAG: hypothetical protein ABSD47_14760 [Candidatus Methylomirabilota bacterium]|jgi:hypothetical protein